MDQRLEDGEKGFSRTTWHGTSTSLWTLVQKGEFLLLQALSNKKKKILFGGLGKKRCRYLALQTPLLKIAHLHPSIGYVFLCLVRIQFLLAHLTANDSWQKLGHHTRNYSLVVTSLVKRCLSWQEDQSGCLGWVGWWEWTMWIKLHIRILLD